MKNEPLVLIMAGGRGERFWPRSRGKNPKQLQKVYSNRTLLEETIARALTVTSLENIYIGCNSELKKSILKSHKFPAKNFVIEPEGRNTAPIIALATLFFEKKHPGRTHIILSADHFITPLSEFQKTIKRAIQTAQAGYLVTLGIKPSRPETGYGYIAEGKPLATLPAVNIKSFVEKPNAKRALSFLSKGGYYWNSGIFIWQGSTIKSELEKHAPEVIDPIQKTFSNPTALKTSFKKVAELPIDIAVMEKSQQVAMVSASFTWDDVGSWLALERIVPADDSGNVLVKNNPQTRIYGSNSSGNIVLSQKKLVALWGVEDLIMVEEDDLIFLTDKKSVGNIKEFLAELKKNQTLQKYLI